jgi:hypothetical protein
MWSQINKAPDSPDNKIGRLNLVNAGPKKTAPLPEDGI